MKYNLNGIKYFINLCTINPDVDKFFMILPDDIKKIIWKQLHLKPFIECIICNKVILRLEIDMREDLNTESIIQFNGYSKCIYC